MKEESIKYNCPIHGDFSCGGTWTLMAITIGDGLRVDTGATCPACYVEWIKKNCGVMTKIEESTAPA